MKTIITLCLLILATNTYARTAVSGKITNIFCGEIDPFTVGDVCILFTENGDRKVGVVANFHKFLLSFSDPEQLIGEEIVVDDAYLSVYEDDAVIAELVSYEEDYQYVQLTEIDGIEFK